ncbi:c-type cytochrome biogenesis protein CcsB [uncultured Amnibacterium sp.]|uniref:c-type cytochrome biogenesis protein CcsB n=1 Tax=uncultured Amnibacterium sp. TaxID=1631851 RepID=UPI0035CA11DD
MNNPLDDVSGIMLVSALAVYAIAFIAFAFDLARRSAEVGVRQADAAAASTTAAQGGGVATLVRTAPPANAPTGRRRPALRTAIALTILAWALHLGADVLRGVAAGRVPWGNLYEFSMTATLLIVGVFLLSLLRTDLTFLGAPITALVLVLLGVSTVGFHVAVSPLPPALQSYWLVIHVFVATLGTAFFALAGTLAAVQLVQSHRERRAAEGRPAERLRLMATIPAADRLEATTYRIAVIGFILWTFTLIAGSIWAEHAWGRYWGWDTKEVWTFIIWVIFAGYIHARATRGWRGGRSSVLALIGFGAVLFNFGIVNVFFHGLHSYSGLK